MPTPSRSSSPATPGPTDHPARAGRVGLWFCASLGTFLAVRSLTTLAAGASFDTPGDGWRSVWQLTLVVLLASGVALPGRRALIVGIVAANYLGASALELYDATHLLGVIPVDMRDRIVHPLVGLVALAVLASGLRVSGGRPLVARGD